MKIVPVHMYVIQCLYNVLLYIHIDIIVSFTPETAVLFPGGNVTFSCNITIGRFWIINDTTTFKSSGELPDGVMADGNMLIVTESANNTLYGCGLFVDPNPVIDTGIVYLAGITKQQLCVLLVNTYVISCVFLKYA